MRSHRLAEKNHGITRHDTLYTSFTHLRQNHGSAVALVVVRSTHGGYCKLRVEVSS
jgi:hypothetical protein